MKASDLRDTREALERTLRARANAWHCPRCGAQRTYEDQWWRADLLCEAAGVDGPEAMIALYELVRANKAELNSRLRVRWIG